MANPQAMAGEGEEATEMEMEMVSGKTILVNTRSIFSKENLQSNA